MPLRVAASEPMGGLVPVQLSPRVDPPIRLELRKGAAVVTVDLARVFGRRLLCMATRVARLKAPIHDGRGGAGSPVGISHGQTVT